MHVEGVHTSLHYLCMMYPGGKLTRARLSTALLAATGGLRAKSRERAAHTRPSSIHFCLTLDCSPH